MTKTIYVLNGPNLNLLGSREPGKYGRATLKDAEALCRKAAQKHGFAVEFRQSNREGELIDWIHEARDKKAAGIIINAGGYSHTSVSIHDALLAADLPAIEVHITNVFARENFRHHSFVAMAAKASLCGFGIEGYALAVAGLAALAGVKSKS
ncbi:MAG: type II 3-dehydroquinate dehydratase [Xanthobacteraceae bacterium]